MEDIRYTKQIYEIKLNIPCFFYTDKYISVNNKNMRSVSFEENY